MRLQGRRADGKDKAARTIPGHGSEQTGGSLVPRPSWGRGGGGGAPQVVHPYRSPWDAPGNEIETSQPPEEMRGGAACPGRVRATGGRADAGAGRAPRVARALLRTDTGGATAPQAVSGRRPKLDRRMAEARDLPAALTRLPATSTPYPGGRRDVEGARRPGQLRPTSARQPAAGARPRRRWGGSEAPCAPQRPMGLQQVDCVGGP